MSATNPRLQFVRPDWPAPRRVRAVTTTRVAGASLGAYASLNLGDHVGDATEAVVENRRRVHAALELPNEPVWLKQVHGTDVVDAATVRAPTAADGAYTDRPGVVCAILSADCLPIFVCNRDGTEAALLHGGWRGLANGIIEQGLGRFRAPAAEVLVWLGPGIGPAAYEVGEELRQVFMAHDARAAEAFRRAAPGKWYMDLYAAARQRLAAAGVRAVHGGAHCTATQADLFFSHRRDSVSGRMASLIWLE